MRQFGLLLIIGLVVHLSCCQSWQRGEQIYIDNCSNCHGNKGQGFAQLYPPLDNKQLFTQHMDSVLHIIVKGRITVDSSGMTTSQMFPIEKLSVADYTNLLNYLNATFGKSEKAIPLDSTKAWLDKISVEI